QPRRAAADDHNVVFHRLAFNFGHGSAPNFPSSTIWAQDLARNILAGNLNATHDNQLATFSRQAVADRIRRDLKQGRDRATMPLGFSAGAPGRWPGAFQQLVSR
ncbi:hypothetical protein, partial [Paracoccus versutus]|uniref:hypothetical protein n=1 Tax=Paracoccus versutus TaxID=34007 RepID=UPI001C68D022